MQIPKILSITAGRRCKKVDYSLGDPNDPNSGAATYYFYDTRYQVLAEKTAADQTQRWYVYGNQMDERLIMMTDTAAYYYIANHLGSTVALTDATGTVVERYDYDVYGKPYFYDANDVLLATQASTVDNPYLYTSRELDNLDSGNLPLGYHRNRYLHYRFASWLTPDPLGITPNARMGNEEFAIITQYKDGLNYYEYVKGKPVGLIDIYGLKECKWEGTIKANIVIFMVGGHVKMTVKGEGKDGCNCYKVYATGETRAMGGGAVGGGWFSALLEYEDLVAPCEWPLKKGDDGDIGFAASVGIGPISISWVFMNAGYLSASGFFQLGGVHLVFGGGGTGVTFDHVTHQGPYPCPQ